MKILDKFNLVIFSIIILVISLIVCMLSFGWLQLDLAIEGVTYIVSNQIASNTALVVAIILILLSLKSIFFNSLGKEKSKGKDGILLQNEDGKLLISKDTIESLTNSVVKSFESAENVTTKIELDEEGHVKIYITLFVYPDAVIKDLSGKLQKDVKEAIKNSLDLEVTEVNIRIRNVSPKKEPIIKE